MNLKLIYSLLILINLTSCKNKVEEAAYTTIPGSRILNDMPEGFKLTSGSMGIENDKNSMVQFFDLIGGNHFNNSKTVSKEIFESKGIKVLENKDLKIDNYDAKYFLLQANENEKTINIVFGDSTFSNLNKFACLSLSSFMIIFLLLPKLVAFGFVDSISDFNFNNYYY